ncbi:hypothetical protein TNCV_3706521 [Trichonephila clavipes]|nr:hypothetical protein TNCV_3706521 [Trichonephila clavipes]
MSGQKGSTTRHVHPDRNKKRKFSGNRLTTEDDTEFTSASARKLKNSMDMEILITPNFVYCILELVSVFTTTFETFLRKTCKSDLSSSQMRKTITSL